MTCIACRDFVQRGLWKIVTSAMTRHHRAVQHSVTPRAAAAAIATVFFVNGATFASWSPRLPELQDDLGVSDAALGLTLLGGGLGGLAASALSGWLVDRRGSRAVTVATSAALSLWLPLIGVVPSAVAFFAVLIVLGALDGLTDVAMNAQAVALQRGARRSIITRFHAVWSAGAVVGGIVASRAAAAEISLRTQLFVTGGVLCLATVVAARWLLPGRPAATEVVTVEGAPAARGPTVRPVFLPLFILGVAIALAELPPNDWAALMMDDRFDLTSGQAGLGFVATASGMMIGRLIGDRTADRLGVERTRRGGAAVATAGIIMATTVPSPVGAACGLFVAGLGLSTLFPLMFRSAAELTRGSHSGMAAFSSGARLGFLIASPLVGLVAEPLSVATSILVVSGLAAAGVAVARLPTPTPATAPGPRTVTPSS
jgi:predicted MFS family arabinose efflux permease